MYMDPMRQWEIVADFDCLGFIEISHVKLDKKNPITYFKINGHRALSEQQFG